MSARRSRNSSNGNSGTNNNNNNNNNNTRPPLSPREMQHPSSYSSVGDEDEADEEEEYSGGNLQHSFSYSSIDAHTNGEISGGPYSLNNDQEKTPLLLVNPKGRLFRYDNDSKHPQQDLANPLQFPKYKHTITETDLEKMQKVESLDYVLVDNEAYRAYEKHRKDSSRVSDDLIRWVLIGLIGIFTGSIAYGVHYTVAAIYAWKFRLVFKHLPYALDNAFGIFALFNVVLVLIGAICIYLEPAASGSGLPEVKGYLTLFIRFVCYLIVSIYLNGVRIPKAFNFRNLCASVVSVICSVASSLPVGPEGPMIHIGGMVGGGVGELRSRTLGFSIPIIPRFQNSRDRRDFISCGAACGVAAAFNAPIGGVLFALEEASSFWSQKLTWRTFFGTMMAVLVVNFGLSNFTGELNMKVDILFDITTFIQDYNIWAVLIPCFILGIIGGLLGGIFTYLNLKVNKMRSKYINKMKWLRVVEILIIVLAFSFVALYLPSVFPCRPIPPSNANMTDAAYKLYAYSCPPGEYNDLATLFLAPQEQGVSHLLGAQSKIFTTEGLLTFCIVYYFGAILTAGCGLSTGLFVPMMLIGGSYGRAVGHMLKAWNAVSIDVGIYGLIGAASFMAGVTRMTVSLVVILIEVTNDIQFLLPIIVTVMLSKGIGDYITYPLYDAQLHQKSIPFLESEPIPIMDLMTCYDAMAKHVVTFNAVEKVSVLLHGLESTRHNGFPIVAIGRHGDSKFKGIILRRHLLTLIKNKVYSGVNHRRLKHDEFRDLLNNGPRITVAEINSADIDLNAEVECWYYMNRSAVIAHEEMSLTLAFRMFRTMGLRHLPVVNDDNHVVGMITRKDLLHEVCEMKHQEKEEEEEAEEEEIHHNYNRRSVIQK